MSTSQEIAILGFGREGQAVYRYIKKTKKYRNSRVSILDQNNKIKTPKNVKKQLGKKYLNRLGNFDLIFRSPGIPYNLEPIQKARRQGVEISSSTKLFFENAKGRIIGITGTKGKGTTSTLLYKILKNCSFDVYLAGNIGKPAVEILPKLKKNSLTILELSSFQLQDLKISPHIGILLDIFPDHQDSHKTLEEYIEAKSSISKYQKPGDKIFFIKNSETQKIAKLGRGKKIEITPDLKNNFHFDIAKNIKIPGEHNLKNVTMASEVAYFLKCPKYNIIKTIQNFRGLEHRLEFVKNIRKIKFINDSASTNPQTTIAALKSFKEPKILVAGGKDKNLDYSKWAEAIKKNDVKTVILFGENKEKIESGIKSQESRIRKTNNLEEALKISYEFAKSLITDHQPLITVLFSPGSASFDMFKDYVDRGKAFKKIVANLK